MSDYTHRYNKRLLNIYFSAHTMEGLVKHNAIFKPNMLEPNKFKKYSQVYFIPFFKITNNMINRAMNKELSHIERELVFINFDYYSKLMRYFYSLKLPRYTKDELIKPGGIAELNIQYILNLFFSRNTVIYLDSSPYTITRYIWDKKYTINKHGNTPMIDIKIDFQLIKGKDANLMKSIGLSCSQKWRDISKDYAFLTEYKGDKTDETEIQKWKDNYDKIDRTVNLIRREPNLDAAIKTKNKNKFGRYDVKGRLDKYGQYDYKGNYAPRGQYDASGYYDYKGNYIKKKVPGIHYGYSSDNMHIVHAEPASAKTPAPVPVPAPATASASASAPLAGGRIRELARKTIDELRKARTKKYNYSSNKCNTRRRK